MNGSDAWWAVGAAGTHLDLLQSASSRLELARDGGEVLSGLLRCMDGSLCICMSSLAAGLPLLGLCLRTAVLQSGKCGNMALSVLAVVGSCRRARSNGDPADLEGFELVL